MMKPQPLYINKNATWDPIEVFSGKRFHPDDLDKVRRYMEHIMVETMKPLSADNILCYRDSDFVTILGLYDELVLGNAIRNSKIKVTCQLSYKSSEVDAHTAYNKKKECDIFLFINRIKEGLDLPKKNKSTTRNCINNFDCTLALLEHEIIHVVIVLYQNSDLKKGNGGHTPLFKLLATNIFNQPVMRNYNHVDVMLYHNRDEIIGRYLKKGTKVTSSEFPNETLEVYREPVYPNEDTVILVENKKGKRFSIPLMQLNTPEKAKKEKEESIRKERLTYSPKGKGKEKIESTKSTFPKGLNWNTFRTEAAKRGIQGYQVSIQYRLYKENKL